MGNRNTKIVSVGGVLVGDGERVKIQSMTTSKASDIVRTVEEIIALEKVGCDIIRVAIADEADARAIRTIKEKIKIPLVADVHFSSKLAVEAIENGADKIRINPGNIGGENAVRYVADCVKKHKIPVRVGANTGSIEKTFFEKYGRGAASLVESALFNVGILEKYGVEDIVISVKASDVKTTVDAYMGIAQRVDYPLHLGVTEAGVKEEGVIKSAVAIGSLLLQGVGDTIRVSLADEPVEEVLAAKGILRAVGMDEKFVEVVACPTCGRCEWGSMSLAKKVSAFVRPYEKRLKLAVMGCIVNGPGEGKDADLGIAGGKDCCMLFKKGEIYKKVPMDRAEEEFFKEIRLLLDGE